MRLNSKDFCATALVAAVLAVYIAYLVDSSGWIFSSTRATTVVVALLGVSACGTGRVEGLYTSIRQTAPCPPRCTRHGLPCSAASASSRPPSRW